MDSTGGRRYSPRMRLAYRLVLLGMTFLAVPAASAAPPVLAVLEYSSGLFGNHQPIYDRRGGTASPYAGKPRQVWTLRAGDTLAQSKPPPERLIRFYENYEKNTLSLCTVVVKYFRTDRGWRPAYQLLTHPLVILENGKLTPIGTDDGRRGMIRIVNASEQNRDGFYETLKFGTPVGKVTIDAWEVQ